jgi:hypothetical protein
MTRVMPSDAAKSQACCPAAPPNAIRAYSRGDFADQGSDGRRVEVAAVHHYVSVGIISDFAVRHGSTTVEVRRVGKLASLTVLTRICPAPSKTLPSDVQKFRTSDTRIVFFSRQGAEFGS